MRSLGLACLAAWIVLGPPVAAAAKTDLPATDGWIEARTEHFTLYSNEGKSRTRKIAIQLERFRQALGRMTRGLELDSRVPTSTFLFKNAAAYEPYKRNEEGKTMNVSGYFLPRPFRNYITLDGSAGADSMRIVYHEFFHAVMDNTLGSLPVWLNEGLAEYFSTFKDRDGSAIVEAGHPINDHLYNLDQLGFLDWDDFFATTTSSPTYNEGTRQGTFYAQAWLLTHYLNADDTRSRQLAKYLSLLRGGEEEGAAFVAAFGTDKSAIGARVQRYRETGSHYVWWDFGEEHGDVAVSTRDLAPAELFFHLGELLAQRGIVAAAFAHLDAARKAGWPAAPLHTAEGVAAYYAEELPAAERSFRAAVAAEDPSSEPYTRLGDLVMNRYLDSPAAQEHRADVPPEILESRGFLEQALARKPDHFETLVSLSRTYLLGREDPTPGVRAIDRAKSLRPLDPYMLQIHAALLASASKIREACDVIEREIRPKDETQARDATRLVAHAAMSRAFERLEAEDRTGALEILAAAMRHLGDPALVRQVMQLHDVVAKGGKIVMAQGGGEGAAPSPTSASVDEYNQGVRLLKAGQPEEALAQFEKVAADCVEEQLCASARENVGRLRVQIESNRMIERLNVAIDLVNRGERKAAVEALRELEATVEDQGILEQIRGLLRRMGAKVSE